MRIVVCALVAVLVSTTAWFCGIGVGAFSDRQAEGAQIRRSTVPPAMQAQPQVVQGPIRDALRERLLLRAIRVKTIEKAVADGISGKKVTRAEAEAAYERMEKDLGKDGILQVAAEAAPTVQGQLVGGRLTDFFDWILKNAPAILELLMKILPLFLV